MPTYEYRCPSCDTITDAFRTISKRNDPIPCATCGDAATLAISVPLPAHFGLPGQGGGGIKYEDGSGMSTNTKLGKRGAVSA